MKDNKLDYSNIKTILDMGFTDISLSNPFMTSSLNDNDKVRTDYIFANKHIKFTKSPNCRKEETIPGMSSYIPMYCNYEI